VRFVWAVAAFVLAALMIATGIAQRTVFEGPKTATETLNTHGSARYTLVDGTLLNRNPGTQTLRATAHGEIFGAYGRTADLTAWLAGVAYNRVDLDRSGRIRTVVVPASGIPSDTSGAHASPSASASPTPSPSASTPTAASTSAGGTDAAVSAHRNPAASDLWLDQFRQRDLLVQPLQLPDTMSVLIATNGISPAPKDVSVTWPLTTTTPWSGPLIVLGGILMLVGVFLYVLAIRHLRRSRGPRRKSLPPLPDAPDTPALDVAAADKGVISAGAAPTRRAARGQARRALVAIPTLAVASLLFAGCSADAWPQFGSSPTPTPTATVADDGQQPPAVTVAQADRILASISKTVTVADQKLDATAAATRLTGAAYAERATNYRLRQKLPTEKALTPIPAKGIGSDVVLPQAYTGWPRTVMLVTTQKAAGKASSTILMLTQQDPWSNYKVASIANLEPATVMPDLAPAYIGASAVPPDSSFLVMAPDQLASAYADVLAKGDSSQYAAAFDTKSDLFRPLMQNSQKERLAEFNKTASQTGSLSFSSAAGPDGPLALATLESGAIVAVDVVDTDTVKPTTKDAVIKLDGNPEAKALTGVDQSSTGLTTSYVDQLFFYVPGQGATGSKIRMLGYQTNILDAKVIP
jgi:hypothetical protein